MAAMANDIMFLTGEVEFLERDLRVADARADRYAKQLEADKRNWFDRLWDSEVAKSLLFILGVWTGLQVK